MMKKSILKQFPMLGFPLRRVAILLVLSLAAVSAFSQAGDSSSKNNPYSPSPRPKAKQVEPLIKKISEKSGPSHVAFEMQSSNAPIRDEGLQPVETRTTVAQTTFKIAKAADIRLIPPTELYKIGIGDVLFIDLKNSSQGSGYYTVRPDGTIDYPLAGENVIVAEQTVDAVEESLSSGITIFREAQVEVKVREYASHRITVSGLVDNAGDKSMQREAMPMFAIRAEAGVSPKATKVNVTRSPQLLKETFDLRDAKTDNIMVFPGSSVEFTGDTGSVATGDSYFIAGEVVSTGQKTLSSGLTLYQAVIAAGGTKGDPKKAILRRKNEKGLFTNGEYNLRSVRDGRMMDPVLIPGDVIEIRN